MKLILLAAAGAAGTLARYFLGGLVQRLYGGSFPWGTFAVNMTGTFLFGLVWSLAEDRLVISGQARAVILVGFMGAFTTFSSLMFETGELMRDSQWALAFGNLALQNIVGILFLFLGFMLGRLI
ncbi:Putative fluoride ion transporter CrcB [uncultured bacterium]|nr:Putative fluoride ion transporter CrcB [uncultured bacterium]